ncbi:FXYD domain-containing ion transport regulator 11 [Synchiropus splendidus]|uniref:FXYD domain-containing ion transport regulator 11 n=1 Tax=Synchiropus splendidus TaxID=270530 RepID=UPI00237D8A1C|nr:FXYD domain-containing ion transport regulator 11 [Synchiropus splendidus]
MVKWKMEHFTLVAVLAVFFTFIAGAEANPFVYNYERLRIIGLICSGILVAGGLSVLLYNRCTKKNVKEVDDNSDI